MELDNRSRGVQDQFGHQAPLYANTSVFGPGESLDAMVDLAAVGCYRWAMDVATGAGYTGFALSPYAGLVVLTDITREMLIQARKRGTASGVANARFVQAASQAFPFTDGSIDLVSCRFAAHHFPTPSLFLGEVSRVLVFGGVLLLADTVPPEDDEIAEWMNSIEKRRDPTHVANYKPSEWSALIERHGLRITHSVMKRVDLELYDWVRRSGTPGPAIRSLRKDFTTAPSAVRQAFGIREEGEAVTFFWPCLVVRAVKD